MKGSTKQSDVLKQLGSSLWHQLTHVAFLTEQMRVTDRVYQEMLNRLREGEVTLQDYILLSSRVIGNNIEMPGTDDPIIVSGNELRQQINNLHIRKHSSATSQQVFISISDDTTKNGIVAKEV